MQTNQRIYTVFLLPDGDEIPLSFRSEKEIKKFRDKFPNYKMIFKGNDNPKEIKNIMSAVFTYNRTMKNAGVC